MSERITLGQYIAKRRQEQGISLRTAATRCGMSHTYLASIEGGENSNPTVDMLHGIAKGLGLPYETLDRIARGQPVGPSPAGTPWQDEQDPEIAARMAELALLTPDQRRIILAGLKAQIEAMRTPG